MSSRPDTKVPPPPPQPASPLRGYEPDHGAPAPRRLWRSRHNRRLAGVCGGLAEYFDVDALLIRLAMVALLISGIGFLLYPLAWLMIPKRPSHYAYHRVPNLTEAPRHRRRGNHQGDRNLTATLAVLVLIGVLLTSFGAVNWLPLGVLFVGGGIWLLSQEPLASRQPQAAPFASSATAEPTTASEPATPRVSKNPADMTDDELLAAADWTEQDVYDEPLPPYPPDPYWTEPPRRSRAWLLVLPLVAVSLVGGAALFAVGPHINDGFGDRFVMVDELSDLQDEYRFGAGQFTLDLSQLDLQGESRQVSVVVGAGDVDVIVPTDAGGQATLEATVGELIFEPRLADSTQVEGFNTDLGPLDLVGDNGELLLDVSVNAGQVTLRQGR